MPTESPLPDDGAASPRPLHVDPLLLRAIRRFVNGVFVLFATPFFNVRVENRPPLETMGAVVLAPKHVSFLDPPVLQSACWTHVTFLMTDLFYEVLWLQWLFRLWGAIPVSEDRPAAGAIKGALRAIRDGRHVAIFPEGKVSEDGFLNPGQGGVALLIARTGVPVIPVAIHGTFEVLPRQRWWPRRHSVVVRFGDPIQPPPRMSKDEIPVFADRVMDAIAELGAPRRPGEAAG